MSQAAPIWATATSLSFASRLQKPRLLCRQAALSARLLLSTRFGRDTGPNDATDAAKAGLRKPGATSLRLATSRTAAPRRRAPMAADVVAAAADQSPERPGGGAGRPQPPGVAER